MIRPCRRAIICGNTSRVTGTGAVRLTRRTRSQVRQVHFRHRLFQKVPAVVYEKIHVPSRPTSSRMAAGIRSRSERSHATNSPPTPGLLRTAGQDTPLRVPSLGDRETDAAARTSHNRRFVCQGRSHRTAGRPAGLFRERLPRPAVSTSCRPGRPVQYICCICNKCLQSSRGADSGNETTHFRSRGSWSHRNASDQPISWPPVTLRAMPVIYDDWSETRKRGRCRYHHSCKPRFIGTWFV